MRKGMGKYRGKRIENRKWVYGYYFETPLTNGFTDSEPEDGWYFLSGEKKHCISQDGSVYEIDQETVGQYIHTVDEVDIYLGDTVKAYKHGDEESKPHIYDITWRSGTYWFGNWTFLEFLNKFRCVKVIGNIHDYEVIE